MTFQNHLNNRQEGIFHAYLKGNWVIFLLPVSRPHSAYIRFVVEHLKQEYDSKFLREFYSDLINWVSPIDLFKTTSLMQHRYSVNPKGRKPRDPADLLRSLLLMHKLQVVSIDDWVYKLRTVPVYAILSGFTKDDTPGIGTFYDFFRRLWLSDRTHKTGRNKRPLRKPHEKGKKNEKLDPKNPKITDKLVARVLRTAGNIHYAPKEFDLLQQLFQTEFVLPSATKGLLGDTNALSVIGDGSAVETGARSFGKFLCDCRKSGNWKCGCKRQFSDPDANWGWDSYREKYYFGRTLYVFCAADSPHDLPIYLRFFRASQHDSVSWICGYQELRHWYPQWKLGEAILDSAHDSLPIYTMLEHDDVCAIIDLNLRRSGKLVYNDFTIGKDGVPICPIGRKMIHWGKLAKTHRRKWRCPAKCGNWACQTPCSPSEYGRTFYTSTTDNPRLFPRIRRDSKEWRMRYNKRTCVERCNKRQKIDYNLEDSKGRSSRHWTIRTTLIAMCQHVDAWIEVAKKNNQLLTIPEWLEAPTAA